MLGITEKLETSIMDESTNKSRRYFNNGSERGMNLGNLV